MLSTATQGDHIRKRRKLDVDGHARHTHYSRRPAVEEVRLSSSEYTVGWICALPVELAAARAMLDVEHSLPTIPTNDKNVYSLGSMCGHNVVIACLPIGCYGTTSAAVVAEHMISTFRSIVIPLMVGIGGGAPRPGYDIRLGDVVVSTPSEHPAVIQYDFGKTGNHGILEPKGILNKPKPQLLRAVALMKANQSGYNKVAEYISTALDQHTLDRQCYAYPGVDSDILFRSEYEQDSLDDPLAREAIQIRREPRVNAHPVIFYGTIGSGNQVIKDAGTRDRLATKLNALCFEMEAAGLMDEHQCLVIRGISDYCDAHKNKDFQGYAAVTAAAAAKELLSTIPPKRRMISLETVQPNLQIIEHRQALMEALDFEESDTRRATVRRAHAQTCNWLLEQPKYLDWQDPEKFSEHHGLLWIKGKAGTGKSTIMKFVLEQMQKQKQRNTNLVIISFFFNARGHDLEKTTVGMYRSLLYQMFKSAPETQTLLDNLRPNAVSFTTSEHLENLLASALELLGSRHLICFVDALDECPEDQIRRMVQFFEEIGERTCSGNLHVLFASRHYPNISTEKGQVLVLEDQHGHSQDLVEYVNTELKIGKGKQSDEIKEELLRKSGKIFLWVVLVIKILKAEYDKGRIQGLAKKLQEIPRELDELFRDILRRDGQRLPELVLCMQWILYAARPLSREEFYFAMLTGDDSEDIPMWDPEHATTDVMDKLLLDTSKGMAEMTRTKRPTVQFIHESVREFLLKPQALVNLYHGFKEISVGRSHQRLKECCERQIYSPAVARHNPPEQLPTAQSLAAVDFRTQVDSSHPFLSYAVEFVVYHANSADGAGVSQLCYFKAFPEDLWLKWNNVLQKHKAQRIKAASDSSLISFLALRKLDRLLALKFQQHSYSSEVVAKSLDMLIEHKELVETTRLTACTLVCKLFHGYSDTIGTEHVRLIEELLHLIFATRKFRTQTGMDSEPQACSSFTIILEWHRAPPQYALDQALKLAAYNGSRKLVALLHSKGAALDYQDKHGRTPLSYAAENGHAITVAYLCSKGANLEAQDEHLWTCFSFAAKERHIAIVEYLYSRGAIIDGQDIDRRTPLSYAAAGGHLIVVEYLCNRGAIVDGQDIDRRTPLSYAAAGGHLTVVKFLCSQGAAIDGQYSSVETPLSRAAEYGRAAVVEYLCSRGATVDAHGKDMLVRRKIFQSMRYMTY